VGILSARASGVVNRRAAGLGIVEVMQGANDKEAAFRRFLARHALAAGEVAYFADDLQDLAVLAACGLAAAPADAVADVRRRVAFVTEASGGRGAVRELAERILAARGVWEAIVERFAAPPARSGAHS
jgi:3-deoxy-D-manno-octulosonate 8-phosphate phosphatase (KDO 8-P phosphatase)